MSRLLLVVLLLGLGAGRVLAAPHGATPSVERLADRLGRGGWTRAKVNRLIAFVEQDGKVSRGERAAVAGLLARRGFSTSAPALRVGPDNFGGQSRAALARYAKLVDQLGEQRAPGPSSLLFGAGAELDPARYRRNVEILAGERATKLIDASGRARRLRFQNRYIGRSQNQLDQVRGWLVAQYRALGLQVEEQPVPWRGTTYHNVVVTIPGASPDAVVICDHYDAADKDPIEKRNLGQLERDYHLRKAEIMRRLNTLPVGAPVPGADDNASASAALLEMGHLLQAKLAQGARLGKTIKLVHLVGEELPASCLGARAFVKQARARGETIDAAVVMDMIGVDRVGRRKVQLSVGRPEGSLEIARVAKTAIADQRLALRPVLRPFGSRRSFLHQTDGIVFSRKNIPVVLFNEHVNNDRDHFRVGYHDEFDISRLMSFDFATAVVSAALETAYRLAEPVGGPGAVR